MLLPQEVRCPRCAQAPVGELPLMLLLAMELQARRHGVEFVCRCCGHEFLHKVEPAPDEIEPAAGDRDRRLTVG